MTFKGHSRSSETSTFDRSAHMISNYRSMILYQILIENPEIYIPRLNSAPRPRWNFTNMFSTAKTRVNGLPYDTESMMSSRFDTIQYDTIVYI